MKKVKETIATGREILDVKKKYEMEVQPKETIKDFYVSESIINTLRFTQIQYKALQAIRMQLQLEKNGDANELLKMKNSDIFTLCGKSTIRNALQDQLLNTLNLEDKKQLINYLESIDTKPYARSSISQFAADQTHRMRHKKHREIFDTLQSMAHKLEFVAKVRGVEYINDSEATNMNSLWFALDSMTKPTILLGSYEIYKNMPDDVKELILAKVKKIILLDEPDVNEGWEGFPDDYIYSAPSMELAIQTAADFAEPGDAVLLSPGNSSFAQGYKNLAERGQHFTHIVKNM